MEKSSAFTVEFSADLHRRLPIEESFDCVSTVFDLKQGQGELIFIDGFAKDEVMEKIMEHMMKLDPLAEDSVSGWLARQITYLEVEGTTDLAQAVDAVLSGTLLFLAIQSARCRSRRMTACCAARATRLSKR